MRVNLSHIEGSPQDIYISGDDVIVTDGGQAQGNSRLDEDTGDSSLAADSAAGQGNDVSSHVLLEGIPQAAFMIGTDGAIRAWNHDMAAFTGISADEALGRADIGMMLYNNDDDTMIEQVLAAPKTADDVYGLNVEDPSRNLYVKEDRVADHSGNVEHYARVTKYPERSERSRTGISMPEPRSPVAMLSTPSCWTSSRK
jgi:methyl-accepting chemotaxis protein